jgi:pimeloyl-ACP methyl ester carboxylesterase
MKDKLVIFCHGLGAGHTSYMTEIEYLCKNNFLVLSYDNLGCMESDGNNISSYGESLIDLNNCIEEVLKIDSLKNLDIYVIGHSWGGYAAGNIANLKDCVKKVVVISSFTSLKSLFKQNLKGCLKLFLPYIMHLEHKKNPYYKLSSIDAYNNKDIRALLIHSKDDLSVSFNNIIEIKKKAKKNNIGYIIVDNKNHNPNYDLEAVKYLNTTFSKFRDKIKDGSIKSEIDQKEFFETCDFKKMTKQDPQIMDQIVDFLRS